MSLQLTISAFFDTATFDAQTAAREQRIQELLNGLEQVDEQTTMSFNKVMTMMRGSYMVVSGIARVIGGGFSRIFQGVWSVVTSAVMASKALSAALVAGGTATGNVWMVIQAGIMMASLIAASVNVGALVIGQKDLARQARGMNFSLHGISSMIQTFSIG